MSHSTIEPHPSHGTGRTILKNAIFITLGSIALRALNFLFGVYVVRQLGDDRFGRYATVLAFVGLFQIFAELGMSQYVMREIARDRSKAGVFFWNLVALRFLLAIAGIVGVTLAAATVGYNSELVLGVFLYTCTFLLSAFFAPLQAVLTAYERLDYVTGLAVFGQMVFIGLGTIVLFSGGGFILLLSISFINMPIQIGLALWLIKRRHLAHLPFQIDPHLWLRLIRSGLPFGITSLALTIAFSIDTVILSMFEPEHVVGWYNVAYGLIFSISFLFSGFKEAIVPSLSRTYVNDPIHVEHWFHRSVKFIMILSLPIAVGGALVAFPLIRFLYTDEFLPSALGLQILIWDLPLLMFTAFCGNMTTVISEERAAARIYSINAAANVILNFYAIPRFGLVGAALVTVVTDLIGALQFHFLLRRKLHLPDMNSVLVRVVIAAALMGSVVYLAGNQHPLALIGLGAIVYGALVLALRLIDQYEWDTIRRLLRRRTARPTDQPAGP